MITTTLTSDARIFIRTRPDSRLLIRTENDMPKGSTVKLGDTVTMVWNSQDQSAVPLVDRLGEFLLVKDITNPSLKI